MFYVPDSEVNKKKASKIKQDISVIKQIDDYSEFNIVKNWHQIDKQSQIVNNNKIML